MKNYQSIVLDCFPILLILVAVAIIFSCGYIMRDSQMIKLDDIGQGDPVCKHHWVYIQACDQCGAMNYMIQFNQYRFGVKK